MCTKEIDKVGARRLVNGCVRRMAGRVGIGGLVRAEDELAVLACVNYQGTAFLRLYHKMLLLALLDIFEALQNRKKLKLLLIASQMCSFENLGCF